MVVRPLAVLPLPLALLSAVAGAVLAALGYRWLEPELRRHREEPIDVRDAPTTEGLVELRGTVESEEHVLAAPLTGTDCVAYEYEVEEYVSSGKSSHWDTLTRGGTYTQFRLADGTGSILVDPEGEDLALDDDWQREFGADETVGGRARAFLEDLDDVDPGDADEVSLGPIEVGTGDRRRYTERRLDVGESVSVYGPTVYDASAGGEWGSEEVDAVVEPVEGEETLVVADAASVPTIRRSTLLGAGLLAGGVVLLGIGGLGIGTSLL